MTRVEPRFRLAAWTTGVAFVAGLLTPEPGGVGVVLVAVPTFVLAFDTGRAPWRCALLSLAAWGSAVVIGKILTLLVAGLDIGIPTRASAWITVLAAYASAFTGSWVKWVASRMIAER